MTSLVAVAFLLAPSVAADDDEIPDEVESEMCGRQLVRDTFTTLEGQAGECASSTDYVAPDVTGAVLGAVDEVQGVVDEDRDLVPDALESTICLVENENEAYDGSCNGDDYSPPTDDSDGDGIPDTVDDEVPEEALEEPGFFEVCIENPPVLGGKLGICYSESKEAYYLMFGPYGGPKLPL